MSGVTFHFQIWIIPDTWMPRERKSVRERERENEKEREKSERKTERQGGNVAMTVMGSDDYKICKNLMLFEQGCNLNILSLFCYRLLCFLLLKASVWSRKKKRIARWHPSEWTGHWKLPPLPHSDVYLTCGPLRDGGGGGVVTTETWSKPPVSFIQVWWVKIIGEIQCCVTSEKKFY